MSNKYRVVQLSTGTYAIEEKVFLSGWTHYYTYYGSTLHYVIRRCKELNEQCSYIKKVIYPKGDDDV